MFISNDFPEVNKVCDHIKKKRKNSNVFGNFLPCRGFPGNRNVSFFRKNTCRLDIHYDSCRYRTGHTPVQSFERALSIAT